MELTGKAKKLFEDWFKENQQENQQLCEFVNLTTFYKAHESMQWGVYEDFAYSLGYDVCAFIDVTYDDNDNEVFKPFWAVSKLPELEYDGYSDTREEAREAAIEALNEIINND